MRQSDIGCNTLIGEQTMLIRKSRPTEFCKQSGFRVKNEEGDEWVDENYVDTDKNNASRGLQSFTLSEGDNALAVIKSHKYNEADAISKDVEKYDLSEFKKLSITVSGGGDLILSITSNPIIPGGSGFSEVTLTLTEEPKTYEFDLSFPAYEAVRKGIKKVTILPNAGQSGEELPDVKITAFEFSKEDVNSALVCNTEAFDVDNPNIYDGTSDTFNINKNFGSNDGAYIVTWGRRNHAYRINRKQAGVVLRQVTRHRKPAVVHQTLHKVQRRSGHGFQTEA